ncbi:MAG TPA: hypothetical protein VGG03_24225, partial [Thermoanaerobaculia bacterium]
MAVKRADAPARPRHRIRAHACPDRRRVPARSGRGGDSDTALQERARLRAAARAGGADRLRGHIVCDGLVRI